MNDSFSIAIAQLNPIVGGIEQNMLKALKAWKYGRAHGADLVAFGEAYMSGYQLQDFVRQRVFLKDVGRALENLATAMIAGPPSVIGAPYCEGEKIYNGYFLLQEGEVRRVSQKHHLPNDSIFDEKRFFAAGAISTPYRVGGLKIGSPICEDIWQTNIAQKMVDDGAELILVPNGSPYARGKHQYQRLPMMQRRAREAGVALIYLNIVGGQDDQIFDGRSFVLNPKGQECFTLAAFEENIGYVRFEKNGGCWQFENAEISVFESDFKKNVISKHVRIKASQKTAYARKDGFMSCADSYEEDYQAMVCGVHDYVQKSGFNKVLLGLSGGIDSALVATIGVDALGADNVRAVRLASQYTSQASLDDAEELSKKLGCKLDDIPITMPFLAIEKTLAPHFADKKPDISEENIQARLRGLLLMALSNKFGEMLLTTGNKSELAVGYATIYGDMAGGYNPIKDLYKTRVFEIARWRNETHRAWMKVPSCVPIPEQILLKPPSAELRFDQRDDDNLPSYKVLDPILKGLIDDEMTIDALVKEGFARDIIEKIQNLVFNAEYKRFQSAPGPRLSQRAFWLDRRYPIVNHWRDKNIDFLKL